MMRHSTMNILGLVVVAVAFVYQLTLPALQPLDLRATAALASFGSNDPATVLTGKNVAITGVTSGIGEEIAVTLLRLGATVYGLGRSQTKLGAFANVNKHLPGTFKPVVCDLSDFDSVAAAADTVRDAIASSSGDQGGLHYLVNNAGIHYGGPLDVLTNKPEFTTKHGLDTCFTTNYLSHVLLTEKLLPLLSSGQEDDEEARVVQISSTYHWQASGKAITPAAGAQLVQPHAADVGGETDFFTRSTAYANSKLAQIWHTKALTARLESSNKNGTGGGAQKRRVKVVAVCPGWVGTNIAQGTIARAAMMALAFPPSQGISSAINALLRPEISSGAFVANSDLISKMPWLVSVLTSEFATSTVPDVRKLLTDALAFVLMLTQKYNFVGRSSVQEPSPEAGNLEAAEALHAWSLRVLQPWLTAS
mmetsp:Transcript_21254/g.42135  ORF Transcript_21254/g.42135 Transcript_21254/m.42135 type:complete len:421 (+) Transcript_21254:44-1306(+)